MTPRGHLCTEVQPWRCALCVGRHRLAYAGKWLGRYLRGESPEGAGEGALRRGLLSAPRLGGYVAREGFRAPILRRLEETRAALLSADRLLSPSQFLLERYVEQGLPRERLELSEYGMDDAPFRALGPRPQRDPAARPVRLGFVGSLMYSKGPDLVLRWAALLHEDRWTRRVQVICILQPAGSPSKWVPQLIGPPPRQPIWELASRTRVA